MIQWSSSLFPSFSSVALVQHQQHVFDVYEPNLGAAMHEIHSKVAAGFCFVALDTEYPGSVTNGPIFDCDSVFANVSLTNLIEGFNIMCVIILVF